MILCCGNTSAFSGETHAFKMTEMTCEPQFWWETLNSAPSLTQLPGGNGEIHSTLIHDKNH